MMKNTCTEIRQMCPQNPKEFVREDKSGNRKSSGERRALHLQKYQTPGFHARWGTLVLVVTLEMLLSIELSFLRNYWTYWHR